MCRLHDRVFQGVAVGIVGVEVDEYLPGDDLMALDRPVNRRLVEERVLDLSTHPREKSVEPWGGRGRMRIEERRNCAGDQRGHHLNRDDLLLSWWCGNSRGGHGVHTTRDAHPLRLSFRLLGRLVDLPVGPGNGHRVRAGSAYFLFPHGVFDRRGWWVLHDRRTASIFGGPGNHRNFLVRQGLLSVMLLAGAAALRGDWILLWN